MIAVRYDTTRIRAHTHHTIREKTIKLLMTLYSHKIRSLAK